MFGRHSVSSLFFWISMASFVLFVVIFIAIFFSALLKAFMGIDSAVKIILFFIPKIVFLYLLILIFRTFMTEQIFTKKAINYLYMFMSINFLMALFIFLSIKFEGFWAEDIIPVFPLIILGIFSAFLGSIFKQGFQIQQENNLTI